MVDKKKECYNGCAYAKRMNSTFGWQFVGCAHYSKKCKWVAEIKYQDCPLNKKDGEKIEG
jgi:hypothetical protein